MIRQDDRVLAARARRDRFELEPAQERPPAGARGLVAMKLECVGV